MNEMLIVSTFPTPFGMLEVVHDEHFIYSSSFTAKKSYISQHPLSQLIKSQLESYLNNPQYRFQLPLKPQGSFYQLKVWNALLVIPVGRTITYGELALKLQSAPRAIGQACKRNPLALFIPCHRVIGKNSLGGYMGNPEFLSYKRALLEYESMADYIK